MVSLLCLLGGLASTVANHIEEPPEIPREFRAAWVATVANIDCPSQKSLSTEKLTSVMFRILDTAVKLRLNAIIFQVRPSADALYASKLEPWSEYLSGTQGKAPSPFFDPLEFAVKEAHTRGLELHCWFNPYRAGHPIQTGPMASNHISNTNPTVVKKYGKYLWMDPGEKVVQEHSLAVIKDVVHRYDIDGVHIDDYFYPYPEGGKDFPDDPSYQNYVGKGGNLSRSDWRRSNVDHFVHSIYTTIKKEKPWVKFGISPFGIYRPGIPESIKAGIDQYAELYADCKKWLNEGWCDYFSPQLYWPISQKPQSYPVLLDWWISQNTMKRHIWPGLYTSRVGGDEGKTWNLKEVLDQIELTRTRKGASGVVHFSMKVFLDNNQQITSVLENGLYQERAIVPSSPWLSKTQPSTPKVQIVKDEQGKWVVNMKPDGKDPARFFAIRVLTDRWLMPRITSNDKVTLGLDAGVEPKEVSVCEIDRVGNVSKPCIVVVQAESIRQ